MCKKRVERGERGCELFPADLGNRLRKRAEGVMGTFSINIWDSKDPKDTVVHMAFNLTRSENILVCMFQKGTFFFHFETYF